MNTSVSLIFSIFLGIVCTVTALKESDCEGKYLLAFTLKFMQILLQFSLIMHYFIVCVAVVDKFSQTLSADIKSDPKKIEAKFREYCKGTKSKENRFVSKINFYR